MFDKVSEPDSISYLKFHNLFTGYYESLCHNWGGEKKKHNALWNILTGVKLSTAGAPVQMSVSFSDLLFYRLKSGVLLRL